MKNRNRKNIYVFLREFTMLIFRSIVKVRMVFYFVKLTGCTKVLENREIYHVNIFQHVKSTHGFLT